jgi:glycosyltransferase involved in cell wall biosynthesis
MIRRLPDNYIFNVIISAIVSFKFSILDRIYLFVGRILDRKNTNDHKLVSVLIPTFNRCEILQNRALKSVLSQTYKNIEIIVVDDGSTDNTFEMVMALNNPKIRVFKNSRAKYRYPNKALYHWFAGGVSALNYGLKFCKGYYIARIDDDDIWTENHIEKLLEFLEKTNSEFVYSHILAKMSDEEDEQIISNFPDPLGNTCTWFFKGYLKWFKINIHCWRKKNNRVFDVDVHNRFFKAGVKINYLDEVTAIYIPRPGEKFAGSMAYISN